MANDIKIEKVEQGGGSGEGKKIGEIKIQISLEREKQESLPAMLRKARQAGNPSARLGTKKPARHAEQGEAGGQPTLPEASAAGGKKTEGRDKRPSWADKADRHFPAPTAGAGNPPAGQQKAKSGEPAGQQAGEPLDSAQGPRSGPAGQQGGQPETGQPDAGQKPGEQKPEPGAGQEPGEQKGPTQPAAEKPASAEASAGEKEKPASAAEQPASEAASAGKKDDGQDRAKTGGAEEQVVDKKAPAGEKPAPAPGPSGGADGSARQAGQGGPPTTLPAVLPAAGEKGKAGKPDSGKFLDKAKDKLGGENDWARALKQQKTKLAQSRRGRAAAKGLRLAARAGAPSGLFFALLFPAVILDFWGLFSGLKDLTDSGLDVNWMDIFEGMFYTFLLIIYMVLRVFMPQIQVMFRPIRLLVPAAELIPFVDLLPFWTMTVLLAWNDARRQRGPASAAEQPAMGAASAGEENGEPEEELTGG